MAEFATTRMYADDSNMTYTGTCGISTLQKEMNRDIQRLKDWLIANKLMLVGSRQKVATIADNLKLSINGILLATRSERQGET